MARQFRPWPLTALPLLTAGSLALPGQAQPVAAPLALPLECRLGQGPWQPCTMTIAAVGQHWWLEVAGQRLEFRGDGRGSLTLQAAQQAPRAVVPVWSGDQALCWDGVCAKGEFPLD